VDHGPTQRTRSLFAKVEVRAAPLAGGGLLLTNGLAPGPCPRSLVDRLEHWAAARPDQVFLAERDGAGWRTLTYAEAWRSVREIAGRLLPLGLSAERPLMTVAANSILHAELILAAMMIGVPIAPVSAAYAQAGREARLREAIAILTPGAFGWDRAMTNPAIAEIAAAAGVEIAGELEVLATGPSATAADVERAAAAVGPDTIAKFLFTSGSTGAPKAVVNTQRMLCSSQAALAQVWPFLAEAPPVLVDWLPWHHTFGGNHCFGIALHNGGALYIDDGKPTPGLAARTVENLRLARPTAHFNVPAGYEAILPWLEADPALAEEALGRLDLLFNAAAALPQSTRDRLEAVTRRAAGRAVPIVGSWGATETAPEATMVYFDTAEADNIGVPMPGVEIKLAPDLGRLELRVRGPNVTPGYWRNAEATAQAFDAEGFYRSGDAGRLLDPARPEAGILFDGRLAENFKLSSGTWVNVGALRLAVIHAARPLVADAVITGHDKAEPGALLFLDLEACRALAGDAALELPTACAHVAVLAALAERLERHNRGQGGASTRIGRFLVLDSPPSAEGGELTAKGSLNQAAVLARRAAWVARLEVEGRLAGPLP
jgi:feruloyl-CoA synthase